VSSGFFIVAVAACAACPLHMLWRRRAGHRASCVGLAAKQPTQAQSLAQRQSELARRIAELDR
jgi:hypothetical protein